MIKLSLIEQFKSHYECQLLIAYLMVHIGKFLKLQYNDRKIIIKVLIADS